VGILQEALYWVSGGKFYNVVEETCVAQGDFEKAKELTGQSIEVLTEKAPSEYELQNLKVMLGLICCHLQDYRVAEEKLAEALEYFDRISSYIHEAEAHFVLALLKWDQGRNEEAATHLETGFKIAEKRKYEQKFMTLFPSCSN
jgi:tetratricopeptide (TPR) repeat protein